NMLDKDGRVPNIKKALLADAVGTTVGACLGTSTVSTFVESASGVAEGGRTGLTAVSTAFMFFLALFLSPIFGVITSAVTASVLVIVGLFMIENIKELNLEDINNLDTLDIKGIDNTIYYIEIKKGNGTIKFINKPELTNATLEINRDIFKPLSESDTINLKEGVHKIVIRANSITPFVKEVSVFSGQETIVDLSEIQSKKGNLLIKTNVSDYTLYINNVVEPSREPLSLGYGAYSIRVEKEGYTPFETQVSINKPQTSIQIDLEKIEKLGQLSLSSSPTEAQVFIDNAFVGYTPLNYKLPYGTHNITLKKEGYLDFNLSSISIGKDESVFNITMHPNTSSTAETSTTETTQATTQANSEPVVSE
ncbi:MAG: PEGA domain-containing protein, partial [Eubacteriales bacterium]|nr:PEGA domain-containing protein [Eubacteriales bacterium]